MKKTYFTMEGKPYLLRLQTKNLENTAIGATAFSTPLIYINNSAPPSLPYVLAMNTSKKIVPLMATLSLYDVTNGIMSVDIASVYYSVSTTAALLTNFQKGLLKKQGYIERLYYTSNNFYGYNLAYNSMLLTDDDFIDVNSRLDIQFHSSLGGSFANDTSELVNIPGSTYNAAITFLYFEMESAG